MIMSQTYTEPKRMTANHNSRCILNCGSFIDAGDEILYTRGVGAQHVNCPNFEQTAMPLEVANPEIQVTSHAHLWEDINLSRFSEPVPF